MPPRRPCPVLRARLVFLVTTLMITCSCTMAVPVDYSPTSTLSETGAVKVGEFVYLPALSGEVAPNQLKNTALGSIKLDRDVGIFFQEAVFKELKFIGVKTDGRDRRLTGEIRRFLVDDLGYSVDWEIDVYYVVTAVPDGRELYGGLKTSRHRTEKFANPFGALNREIRLNIDMLVQDPAFVRAIN